MDAAAATVCRAHLADRMQQGQQRAVRDARQAGTEAAGMALLVMLPPHLAPDRRPIDVEGRVGEHVVECPCGMPVLVQSISGQDGANVLALDDHVRLADGVALVVWLPVGHGQRRLQVHHQADDIARGEVPPAVSVEISANLRISSSKAKPRSWLPTLPGCSGNAGNRSTALSGLAQPVGLLGEAEAPEGVAVGAGEAADTGAEIGAQTALAAQQRLEVEGRAIGEGQAGRAQQEGAGADTHRFPGFRLGQDLLLAGRQHAVQAPRHHEGGG